MVRRRGLLCDIRRGLCRRVCGDQPARRGLRLLRGRVCQGVGARLGVFAAARAGSGGDGGRVGECEPAGTGGVVCDARARVHRAQDLVFARPDWIHRRFYAEDRELATCSGVGWWGWDTEGHERDERAVEESRLRCVYRMIHILICLDLTDDDDANLVYFYLFNNTDIYYRIPPLVNSTR